MDDFASWFCLNNRQNFTIDPQVNLQDAQYYFGRDEERQQLLNQIRKSFIAPRVPKMYIAGAYGSGKTQTLFYLANYLKSSPPPSMKGLAHTIYLTIEIRSNSTATNFHTQLLESLGKDVVSRWVRTLYDKTPDLDGALLELIADPNIFLAIKELRSTGDSTFTAWRWLTGQALKPTELNALKLTRNLGEVGSVDLVNALVAIGNLSRRVDENLIFLVDEAEQLLNLRSSDATESIHDYLRKLSEPANSSVGFLIGFMASVPDEAPPVLMREDIIGRIGRSNYIDLPRLQAVNDARTFIRELLSNLIDNDLAQKKFKKNKLDTEIGIFPFERDACDHLAEYATMDQTWSLPRFIITAINECAIQAWDEGKFLINDTIVNQVAPRVFQ